MYTRTTAQMMTTQKTAVLILELIDHLLPANPRPARAYRPGTLILKDVYRLSFDSKLPDLTARPVTKPSQGAAVRAWQIRRSRSKTMRPNYLIVHNRNRPMPALPQQYLIFLK